jgi:hypothetical protein
MWEHHNSILHDAQLEALQKIQDSQLKDEITKLYTKVDTYMMLTTKGTLIFLMADECQNSS